VEKDLERDNFMSSAEAVKYGLIDTVLEQRTELPTDKKDDSD
jgi:ATP-dependent protease ClpP protease subunit